MSLLWYCANCERREPTIFSDDEGTVELGDRGPCDDCGDTAEVIHSSDVRATPRRPGGASQ